MGERTVETTGSCTFEDLTNHRKAVTIMSTFKKTGWVRNTSTGSKDEIYGVIYDSKHLSGDLKSIRKLYCKEIEFVDDLKKMKDMKSQICELEGSWLTHLKIDGKLYWDVENDKPERQLPIMEKDELVLSSDWRYREDLLWLKYNYELIAHQWKIRLEVQQRKDRGNR